jgi:superfamily II DNA/RNA helicase
LGNQLKTFSELSLPDSLARALASMKYSEPTEIQARAIPVALEGKDVLGCAQTGTGKTAAFALPLIVGLLKNPKSTALILVPTRELGAQTISVLQQLTRHCPDIRSTLVIGGVSYRPQIAALRAKPRIIVATPGRLMDHMENRTVSLGHVSKVVLDEADRMLDLGFAPQIERILQVLPRERQTLLFSATLPAHIVKLAQKYLKNPVRITVGVVSQAAPKIEQAVIQTTVAAKNDVLHKELLNRSGSVIIFARRT